jgi:hypothetical protein
MSQRQGADDFGLNFQTGKDGAAKIQMNFNIVIFIETAADGCRFRQFAIRRNDQLRGYDRFKL